MFLGLNVEACSISGNDCLKDSKVCVVSLIGKSKFNSYSSKSRSFNEFAKAHIFNVKADKSTLSSFIIEGCFLEQQNVVFLHLNSSVDVNFTLDAIEQLKDKKEEFNTFLRKCEHYSLKALLFLFSISHIILVNIPGSSFDISYVRLFKNIEGLRQLYKPSIKRMLEMKCGYLPPSWTAGGRPCSPRVLFIMQSCILPLEPTGPAGNGSSNNNVDSGLSSKHKHKHSTLRDLQHSIEDMIYKILRKDRIITNISNNSLFAIPANQEFVFIDHEVLSTNHGFHTLSYLTDYLSQSCKYPIVDTSRKPKSYSMSRPQTMPTLQSSTLSSKKTSDSPETPSLLSSRVRVDDAGVWCFLKPHIDIALKKGFDDNVGRLHVTPVFEIPTLNTLIDVMMHLHSLIFKDAFHISSIVKEDEDENNDVVTDLKEELEVFFASKVDLDIKFSESHYNKLLPLAEEYYNNGLPKHYTKAYHITKLEQTRRYFLMNARGPSCDKYLNKLEDRCMEVWMAGRRLCEAISMLGHQCCNELHRLPKTNSKIEKFNMIPDNDAEYEEDDNLPVMSHTSNVVTRATCNCGNIQADREDPFDLKAANYDFYKTLDDKCCHRYEHYKFATSHENSKLMKVTSDNFLMKMTAKNQHRHDLPLSSSSSHHSDKVHGGVRMQVGLLTSHKSDSPNMKHDSIDLYAINSLSLGFSNVDVNATSELSVDKINNMPILSEYKRDPSRNRHHNDDDVDDEDYKLSQADDSSNSRFSDENDIDDDNDDIGDNEGDENNDYEDGEFDYDISGDQVKKDVTHDEDKYDKNRKLSRDFSCITTSQHNHKHMSSFNVEDEHYADYESEVDQAKMNYKSCASNHFSGMLNSTSIHLGMLPAFPSWCLLKVGKYGSYETSTGINQPNFTHQANFLLPIDIKIQMPSNINVWPASANKNKKTVTKLLRIYFGLEYECFKGHRFFLSAPDKMFKAPASGIFKETGHKIINQDMPMYFPCSCRSSMVYLAQLMRIHVAVPEGDIEVKLKVKIQPGPFPSPLFFPEPTDSIVLEPGLWVMRLPYVYYDGTTSYYMPSDPKLLSSCKLIKGCLSVIEQIN